MDGYWRRIDGMDTHTVSEGIQKAHLDKEKKYHLRDGVHDGAWSTGFGLHRAVLVCSAMLFGVERSGRVRGSCIYFRP